MDNSALIYSFRNSSVFTLISAICRCVPFGVHPVSVGVHPRSPAGGLALLCLCVPVSFSLPCFFLYALFTVLSRCPTAAAVISYGQRGDLMVGEELKRYRINSFTTQRRLGEICGLKGRSAERTVQRWEQGTVPVPLKHLRKIHEAIGIPYEKLIP